MHYNEANCGSQIKNKIKINYSPDITGETIACQRGISKPERDLESITAQFYCGMKVRNIVS